MSNEKPNDICENCLYFADEHDRTECRKYAPHRGDSSRPWANVQKVEWCSEFEHNKTGPSQKVIGEMQNSIG